MSFVFELPRNRLAIRVPRCQPVFGRKHVEIVLADADDQVLLCRLAIGFCFCDQFVSTSQTNDLVPAKQRLPETDLPARSFRIAFGIDGNWEAGCVFKDAGAFKARVGPVTARGNLRQQHTACLGLGFEGGEPPRLSLVNPRIALQGLLVDFEQRRGICRRRHR